MILDNQNLTRAQAANTLYRMVQLKNLEESIFTQ